MVTTAGIAEAVHNPKTGSNEPAPISPGDPPEELDVLGIGFGPANLALAVAIQEHNENCTAAERLTCSFVDAKDSFGWHDGMLLPETTMQVSFLKDLVTQRDPSSSFSFLNYLKEQGRLTDFINLKTFFPSRREFHGYLSWAASRITLPVHQGVLADSIRGSRDSFEVTLRRTLDHAQLRTVRTRNIVLGLGIEAFLPPGVEPGPRVFHNHELLQRLGQLPPLTKQRLVVVGSGQSAAEVAAYLHSTHPQAEVHVCFRRFGFSPSDDTPYANRIFDPDAVDDFHAASPKLRERLLAYHYNTNYSAVDAELIQELYEREYDESITGKPRLKVHRVTDVAQVRSSPDQVSVELRDLISNQSQVLDVDAVVYATGFRPRDVRGLLDSRLQTGDAFDVSGRPRVSRDYRLELPGAEPGTARGGGDIFCNGGVEHTHGLSSSLLSNIAVRSEEILESITENRVVSH